MSSFIVKDRYQKTLVKLKKFRDLLEGNREKLCQVSSSCAPTPLKYHKEDLSFVINYINSLDKEPPTTKYLYRSKGLILIGLSANEPLVVGIIPVLSALLAQNKLRIRASSKNTEIQEEIIELLYKSGFTKEDVSLTYFGKDELQENIIKYDYVFWFGSHKTCKAIASKCLEKDIDCDVESEGNDVAIIERGFSTDVYERSLAQILDCVERHNGQTCQAIRCLFVPITDKESCTSMIERIIKEKALGAEPLQENIKVMFEDNIVLKDVPFSPLIRVYFYTDIKEVFHYLRNNPYGLSLNIFSERNVEELLSEYGFYRCGRLLINSDPSIVNVREPWGGLGFSGSHGVSDWFRKFVDKTFFKHSKS